MTYTQAASATVWEPAAARQGYGEVPRKIPGGPVIKRRVLVYRGCITRRIDNRPVIETCPHNHTVKRAAAECGAKAARRMNRLAAKRDHEAWPAESSPLRGQYGGLRHAVYWDGKVSERSYPLRARCQPCGWPIILAEPGGEWVHDDYAPEG